MNEPIPPTAEDLRLDEAREKKVPWRRWRPYASERQRGTVREDYSPGGTSRRAPAQPLSR
jgi:hypothetical protein